MLEQQQLGRLEALAAGVRRIDPEVGEQARLRRDPGQHARLESLLARASDRRVRRVHEHARVPVEGCADVVPAPNALEQLVDDGRIRLVAVEPGR